MSDDVLSSLYSGKFEKMTENIYRLNMPYVFSRFLKPTPTALFLVHDPMESSYSLIDVGPPGFDQVVLKALGQFFDKECTEDNAKTILKEIDSVFLTHFHIDHCGGLRKLWELSGQELKAFPNSEEVEYVCDGKKFKEQEGSVLFSITKHFFANPQMEVPCSAFDSFMDTYQVRLRRNNQKSSSSIDNTPIETAPQTNQKTDTKYPKQLCFCFCPGHSPGHCCFYHEEDRALLCGDTIMNIKTTSQIKLEKCLVLSSQSQKKSTQHLKQIMTDLTEKVDVVLPSHDYSLKGIPPSVVLDFLK